VALKRAILVRKINVCELRPQQADFVGQRLGSCRSYLRWPGDASRSGWRVRCGWDLAGLFWVGLVMRAGAAGETAAAVPSLVNASGRWWNRLAAVLFS
jgi:hypothetical protein